VGLDRLIRREDVDKRCGRIAMSHLIYDETGEEGHQLRVEYRNSN